MNNQSSASALTSPRHKNPARSLLLAIGILFIGLNLRIGVAGVGPIMSEIREDTGISAALASLLTTIPVISFGVFAFLTPPLTKRLGIHRLLGLMILILVAGFIIRLLPSLFWLVAGTILVGAGIAVSNVIMPAIITIDFPKKTSLMMGLYATVLFLGAAAASGLTAPLSQALGNWRPALAIWAMPAVIAFFLWIPQLRSQVNKKTHNKSTNVTPIAPSRLSFRRLLRDPIAIAVTAFMGLQSMAYYVFLTWIPALLQDSGMDINKAGWLVAYSTFPAIVASLTSPILINRIRPIWVIVLFSFFLFAIAYLGLAITPVTGGIIWMTFLGIGQGISFSLAMSFIIWRSPDAKHTAYLSTLAQGVGYLFAGLGPFWIGALHSATNGWQLPLIALGFLVVLQLVAGILASKDRYVHAGKSETNVNSR